MHQVASEERQEEMQMRSALETQISQHREQHQKQVAQLRDEITEKASAMEELKDDNQKMTLTFEQLQRDHDKLKVNDQICPKMNFFSEKITIAYKANSYILQHINESIQSSL